MPAARQGARSNMGAVCRTWKRGEYPCGANTLLPATCHVGVSETAWVYSGG
jgi:hypothetical protein